MKIGYKGQIVCVSRIGPRVFHFMLQIIQGLSCLPWKQFYLDYDKSANKKKIPCLCLNRLRIQFPVAKHYKVGQNSNAGGENKN